jgi:hypothetical protein
MDSFYMDMNKATGRYIGCVEAGRKKYNNSTFLMEKSRPT